MKTKYFLTFLGCVFAIALSAQAKFNGKVPQMTNLQPAPYLKVAQLPNEKYLPEPENPNPITTPGVSYRIEETAGTTTWDAQSYGCTPSRIYANSDGKPVATWIYGTDLGGTNAAFSERGTGYNVRGASTWPTVNGRLEAIRTGFPAVARLDDGTEIVVAHATGFNPYRIHVARKAAGASTWTETDLQNPVGAGCLWPRIAVGGADGKTVHVIAITTPVANGGPKYQGVDGQLLYWRSTDGGLTWDKKAVVIPGLDNTKITNLEADSYTIDVNGEVVGVAIFPSWNDVLLFKSLDNGESWEPGVVVNDFPDGVENYVGFPGNSYDIDDIGYIDPNTPDTSHLAIFTSDGFGSLLIDNGGQAHVWFGYMYVIDVNFNDSTTSYYPGMNGLCYWKESDGTDNFRVITGALDLNGDSTLLGPSDGITAIGPYYNSLSSFATTGTDANGVIYLAYAAVNELYRSDWGAEKNQYYRHLYVMKSTDNGDTWGDPHELTVAAYVDEIFIPFIESVWPAIPRHIGDKVWVLYQQDGIPGTERWGANHSPSENAINWFEVPTDSIPAFVSVFNPPSADPSFELVIAPNPVTSVAQLSATFEGSGPALVEVFDVMGKLVQQYRLPQNGTGRQTLTLPVHNLQTGTYSVRVTQGGRFGIAKLLKI